MLLVGMLAAIELDDHPLLEADEIDDVISKRLLALELEPKESASAQVQPQQGFRTGRLVPQRLGAF